MLLRGAGIIFIVSSCALYGFFLSRDYMLRIRQLEQLNKGLLLLKGEILHKNESIGRALEQTGFQLEGIVGEFFLSAAEYFNRYNCPIREAWKKELERVLKKNSQLVREDYLLIQDFGNELGITDRETQVQCIMNQMNKLEIQITELKKYQNEKCRLYRTMGIMLGMFAAVLFI